MEPSKFRTGTATAQQFYKTIVDFGKSMSSRNLETVGGVVESVRLRGHCHISQQMRETNSYSIRKL
jgi:hypothetical protein